jgi:hypothetical protein
VTYREVSREVGVNINTAKKSVLGSTCTSSCRRADRGASENSMLVRYLKANPTTFPTYILTGTYLPTRSRSSTPLPTSDEKIETPSTPTPTSTPMDVDETTPKAVKGERDGPTIDPDEIKPEITKLKSRKDDPYPVHCEDVERKGMLLLGGKETLESEYDLKESASRNGFSYFTSELPETGKLELFAPSTIKVQIYSLSPSQISVSLFLHSLYRLKLTAGLTLAILPSRIQPSTCPPH